MRKKKDGAEGETKKVESTYNAQALRMSIKGGLDASQLMQKFGIKHKQTLKMHVQKLSTNDKTFYDVPGLFVRAMNRPKVNAKGEIKLLIKNLDFESNPPKENDEFNVSVIDGKIVLELIQIEI